MNSFPETDSQSRDVQFHVEDIEFTLTQQNDIAAWVADCILREGYIAGDINIVFCSDGHLLDLNQKYLQHDTLTDIITFDYSVGKTISGDLFISVPRTQENAAELKIDAAGELHRVIIHGVLHLMGYKDKKELEALQIREKEDFYLSLRAF